MPLTESAISSWPGKSSDFAQSLDSDPDVKLYFKLPSNFKIETPIGTYNPDWAVYLEKDGDVKLYFVLETKGTVVLDNIATPEQLKVRCGKAHFEALGHEIMFNNPREHTDTPVKDWREFRKST